MFPMIRFDFLLHYYTFSTYPAMPTHAMNIYEYLFIYIYAMFHSNPSTTHRDIVSHETGVNG